MSTSSDLLAMALSRHREGALREAALLYKQILLSEPRHADALHLLGVLCNQLGDAALAVTLITNAIEINPDAPDYHNNLGNALKARGSLAEAERSYNRSISLNSRNEDAYFNLGILLEEQGRLEEAKLSYQRSLRSSPKSVRAKLAMGNISVEMGDCQTAIRYLKDAIRDSFTHAPAHNVLGNAHLKLHQMELAKASYLNAIRLDPTYADPLFNLGNLHSSEGDFVAAIDAYKRSIALSGSKADVHHNLGMAYLEAGQPKAALESFNQAICLKGEYEYLHGTQLLTKSFLCEWEGIEGTRRDLEAQIVANKKASEPFVVVVTSNSPELQKKAAEIYVHDKYPPSRTSSPLVRRPRNDKIRIGYFSADYYNHATSYLMAELFERHDRSKFEVLGFSFGAVIKDEMRERVSLAMDRFFEVRSLSDKGIAQKSRELGVDIAIDLKGFTKHSRPGIFAERAAPIQVNYLGYPGTMGADFVDYLIADNTLIPEASRRHYSEKIVSMPDSYQVNDSKRLISARPFSRTEEGLPEKGFVYCCFNNNYKITPRLFDIWMRILGRVEGSVLWLIESNEWACINLRREAARHGISPERLIFARRLPQAEHLARHSLADLFLDTHPCNAHTTASDALWAGLPVLTCTGETFASRVAASLLFAIGLPELVATTEETYEALAIEIALNPERHQAIKKRLWQNRLTSPLFDIVSFTKHIEAAYEAMYERYQAHLPPDHIAIGS